MAAPQEAADELPDVATLMGPSSEVFTNLAATLAGDADQLKAEAVRLEQLGPVDLDRIKGEMEQRLRHQRNETQVLLLHSEQVAAEVRKLRQENEAYRQEAIRLRQGNQKISKQLRVMQASLSATTRQFVADSSAEGAAGANETALVGGGASGSVRGARKGMSALQRTAVGARRGAAKLMGASRGNSVDDASDGDGDDAGEDGAAGTTSQDDQDSATILSSSGGGAEADAGTDGGEDDPNANAEDAANANAEDAAATAAADADGGDGTEDGGGGLGLLSFLATSATAAMAKVKQSPSAAVAVGARHDRGRDDRDVTAAVDQMLRGLHLGAESEALVKRLRSVARGVHAAMRLEQQADAKLKALYAAAFSKEKRRQDALQAKLRPLEGRKQALLATQRGILSVVQHLRTVRAHLEKQLHQQQQALKSLERLATE